MTIRSRAGALVGVMAFVLSVASCTSINANDLPQPGRSDGDGYDVVMQFESVLNLPESAKVVFDGVTVGTVLRMTLSPRDVAVTARVNRGVLIPSNVRAVLQQATVLGDIYVALERPQDGGSPAAPLGPGAVIPLAQTTSPPQLEDTIASLANFVSSGSIQRIQNTIIRLNRVAPSSDEVRRLTTTVKTDLKDVSDNLDQADRLLDGAASTASTLNDHIPQLQNWASPYGQTGFDRVIAIVNVDTMLLPGAGSIAGGGYWLVPFLHSLADAMEAVRDSKINVEAEIPKYRRVFTDYFLPEDKYPAINITSIIGPDGRELSGNVQDVLRILGAMP